MKILIWKFHLIEMIFLTIKKKNIADTATEPIARGMFPALKKLNPSMSKITDITKHIG